MEQSDFPDFDMLDAMIASALKKLLNTQIHFLSEVPSDMILEGLYKLKLQNSAQVQTVLALSDQETARNKGKPNCSQLETAVKLHIDQMMRTRNFRVRSDVVGTRISHQESKRKESLR